MTDQPVKKLSIPIPEELLDYVPQAILRLSYLHEGLEIAVGGVGLEIVAKRGEVPPDLPREIRYQLYREKIFQETLPLRRDLYKMLAS
jgi:hypothetical protein